MATPQELEILVDWLEKNGFANPRRREVTLSYARLVFGSCTAEQLKRICKTLLSEARAWDQDKPFRWHPLGIRQKAGIDG